jgi:hypothetical protein
VPCAESVLPRVCEPVGELSRAYGTHDVSPTLPSAGSAGLLAVARYAGLIARSERQLVVVFAG